MRLEPSNATNPGSNWPTWPSLIVQGFWAKIASLIVVVSQAGDSTRRSRTSAIETWLKERSDDIRHLPAHRQSKVYWHICPNAVRNFAERRSKIIIRWNVSSFSRFCSLHTRFLTEDVRRCVSLTELLFHRNISVLRTPWFFGSTEVNVLWLRSKIFCDYVLDLLHTGRNVLISVSFKEI